MATKKEENVVLTAVYSLSRKIAASFNLGDGGKLDSFFDKIDRKTSRNIRGLEKNIEAEEFNLTSVLEKLQENLEDAKVELQEAYSSVDLDKIQTNQAQTDYIPVYLKNIDEKKKEVSRIEKQIESEKEKLSISKKF